MDKKKTFPAPMQEMRVETSKILLIILIIKYMSICLCVEQSVL
jgi:hypothetical protein